MSAAVKQIQTISDEITMLMALTRAYRRSPIDIITATSTSQALAQFDIFSFALILLDLDINDGGAMELLRTVSSVQAGVPVILLTTDTSRSPKLIARIDECRPYGCWHLLEKPFELKKLTGAIERGLLERTFDDDQCSCDLGDLRRCRRFKRNEKLAISLSNDGTPPFFPATLTDISVSGLGLTTNVPLPANQRISFAEKFMHQSGTVIWTTQSTSGYRSGVRFS